MTNFITIQLCIKAYCDKIEYLINFMGATGLIDDCVLTLLRQIN